MTALAIALLIAPTQAPGGAPQVVFQAEAPVRSAVVADDGVLFFGSEDCRFHAVDPVSGEELWSIETDEAVQSRPVVADGRVIVNAASTLYVLDAASGRELGKAVAPTLDTLRVSDDDWAWNDSGAAVSGDRAWFAALDGDIVEVSLQSGDVVRAHDAVNRGNVASGVNFADGRLLWVDFSGELVCLDVATWSEVFRTPVGDRIFAPMCVDGGKIYLGGRNCRMTCVDLSSGEMLWSVYSKDPTTWFSGGSVVVGDTLWAATSDEFTMLGLDSETGEFRALLPIHTNGYTQPARSGDKIAVVATNVYTIDSPAERRTDITIFDAAGQTVERHTELNDAVFSSPVFVRGALYFGSESGKIYRMEF